MDQVTEEIRQRADIVDVVGQYVALRPAGNNRWKACCPFHDEKTPSFNVSRDKGFYKCFGCGAAGDVFRFVQQVENLTFPEARRQLGERYGVTVPAPGRELTPEQQAAYAERDRLLKITAATAAFFREQFTGNPGMPARDYARTRGLSRATLEKFGIGYAPDKWDALYYHLVNRFGFTPEDAANAGLLIERNDENQSGHARTRHYDRFRHRLMFPIWDERGQVIAFGGRVLEGGTTGASDAKYINSPEGPLFKKSRLLYAYHLARAEVSKHESLIITEGYMDAIALHEAGFGNTVATLGTALTTQHVALLRRIAPKVVYLCFDGDGAGIKAALRAAPMFAAHSLDVRVVSLPKEDDPDTFIRKHGEAGFESALREARLLSQYRVEMALEGHNLAEIAARKEAVRAAAEAIAEVPNDLEKAAYVSWVAGQWAQAENITSSSRLQMVEAAVRREVNAVARRWQLRDRQGSGYQGSNYQQQAQAENDEINTTLADSAGGLTSGGLRAERMLLAALLGSPTWRPRILQALPQEQWTQPAHREIVAALETDLEIVNPAPLLDDLTEEAAGLVAELVLSDDLPATPSQAIIDDLIRTVDYHNDLKSVRELRDVIDRKQQEGDAATTDELRAYFEARRKLAPFRERTAVPR